ncbi:HET-domain-containing protein [Stipitochalara longipes BDJ]|nr:HET-domain-containing protein [Stipitochalara longipes BDJ]
MALIEDSAFYGFAASIAEICRAISQSSSPATADALLKYIWDSPDSPGEQKYGAEYTALDPMLLELEILMIQEFFSVPYVYRPLDGPNAIRILILHGGSPSEPLRGTLEHTVVKTGKGYQAISYTWGDSSMPCSIHLDGCRMPLTQSLFNALVHLRYPNKDRKLWADGLCINQADNKEKGIQVALMPQIYTYAGKVLVYLGMEADGSELLPELLERLGRVNPDLIQQQGVSREEFLSNALPPPDSGVWKALVAFLCRPWFLRVWIIQEVVLARDIRFFCGDWELRWGSLADLAEQFDFVFTSNPQNRHLVWTHDFQKAQHAAMSLGLVLAFRLTRSAVADRLEYLRRDIESIPSTTSEKSHVESLAQDLIIKREFIIKSCREHRELYNSLERSILALDSVKPSPTPILKLLGIFPHNGATKPQDRLYALIGLAADIDLDEFAPDYEENEDQTNARFGRKLVEKGQGMDLLFHATKMSVELWNLATPSWVPAWTPRRSMHSHWLKLGWAYHQYPGGFEERANSGSYVSLVEGAPNVLRVTGFCVDRFESVVKLYEDNREYGVATFQAASKKFFQRVEEVTNGDVYFTGETWSEALCRTLVAGHLDKRGSSLSEVIHQYEEAKSGFISPPQNHPTKSMNPWGSAWFRLMPEYALCKTTKGYVGLVPQATNSTDEVFMLQGSDLPFVLRPIPPLPGLYRLVFPVGVPRSKPFKFRHVGDGSCHSRPRSSGLESSDSNSHEQDAQKIIQAAFFSQHPRVPRCMRSAIGEVRSQCCVFGYMLL